jgi:hypothetical protein
VPVACGTPGSSVSGGMRSRQISRLLPLLMRRSSSRETSPGSMSVPGRKTGPVSASRASRSAIGMRRAIAIASRVSIVGLPLPASSDVDDHVLLAADEPAPAGLEQDRAHVDAVPGGGVSAWRRKLE